MHWLVWSRLGNWRRVQNSLFCCVISMVEISSWYLKASVTVLVPYGTPWHLCDGFVTNIGIRSCPSMDSIWYSLLPFIVSSTGCVLSLDNITDRFPAGYISCWRSLLLCYECIHRRLLLWNLLSKVLLWIQRKLILLVGKSQ